MVKPEVTIAIEDLERGLSQSEIHKKHNDGPPPREYRDQKVKPKLKHRPWLKILDEFLDPTEECFKNSQKRRLSHFDVQVIHISVSGEVSLPINCNSMEEFKDATNPSDNNRCGTILITEDISLTMIDALGVKYELDPDFFACHLEGTEAFRTGLWHSPEDRPLARGPNILGDYLRKAPFYTAEYRRPYHIKSGFKESADLRSRVTSTPRGVEVLNNIMPDVFASEKISVYKKKGDNTAVILTDKLLSRVPPASYMRDIVTFDDDPATLPQDGRANQVSCREELVAWLRRLKPEEATALFDDREALAIRPVLKIVERASAMFLQHTQWIMNRIVNQHCDKEFPDSIPFFLTISRNLHRHLHFHRRILSRAVRIATLQGADGMAEQVDDLNYLKKEIDESLSALKEDVQFIVSVASIKEGRVVGLVSKLAFYFLPLSLLATILSINDDNLRFYILGGLSVPFVLISTYFMFYFKPSNIDSLRFSHGLDD